MSAETMAAPKAAWLEPAGKFPAGPPDPPTDPEREALREIATTADVFTVNGKTFVLAEVSPAALDALAAFEAAAAELEDSDEDCEADEGEDDATGEDEGDRERIREDDEPDHDAEHELQGFGNPRATFQDDPTVAQQLRARNGSATIPILDGAELGVYHRVK